MDLTSLYNISLTLKIWIENAQVQTENNSDGER